MTVIQSDLLTLDYSYRGRPFVRGATSADLLTLDYSYRGHAYVSNGSIPNIDATAVGGGRGYAVATTIVSNLVYGIGTGAGYGAAVVTYAITRATTLVRSVQPIFAALAAYFGEILTYRTLTADVWSSPAVIYGEIKALSIAQEYDEHSGAHVKRQRATAKCYDTATAAAPTLRLGDEIIDVSGVYWKVSSKDISDVGNGIYRYHLVRDIPTRGGVDRGDKKAEGAS